MIFASELKKGLEEGQEERTKGMLYVLKEVFKLPLNKETKTIKYTDAIELIERISNEIPDNPRTSG